MKKTAYFNLGLLALFFILDPFFNFCIGWADTFSLGAEIVLGMATPLIFIAFAICVLLSTAYSIYKCISRKNIKELSPIGILLVGAVIYVLCFIPGGFWYELVSFYFNNDFGSL
ncbi:MAG: hypothetical protein IJA60_03880 [Clostridia bacterium]|nr:hypothetical protein [Clostridia bacterium]